MLNNTIHEATGFTPQEIFLKESRCSPIYEAIEYPSDSSEDHNVKLIMANNVQRTKSEQRRLRHAQRSQPMQFNIGEKVLVRTHRLSSINNYIRKFFLLYEGPYEIVSVKQNNTYVIVDPET